MEGMAAPAGETRKTKEKVMDFNLTVDQELLLESIDEFAERYFDEETVNAMYDNHGIPDEIGEAYRDAGFAFMGLPEEVGGIPCDKLTLGLMTERLYHATGCMTPFMTAMLAVADVAEFGTPNRPSSSSSSTTSPAVPWPLWPCPSRAPVPTTRPCPPTPSARRTAPIS